MVRVVSFLSSEITQLWKMWTAYNPERHYMRGRARSGVRSTPACALRTGRANPLCASMARTRLFHRADSAGRQKRSCRQRGLVPYARPQHNTAG